VKLLAIGRPRPGIEARSAIAPHARAELRALWALYREGFVREAHSPGGPGAVLIIDARSVKTARETLDELPLVANEVVDFELIELRPFTAFEQLFSDA
jgi:hypothetical protein